MLWYKNNRWTIEYYFVAERHLTSVTCNSQYGQLLSYQLSNNILRPKNNQFIRTPLLKFCDAFVYHYEHYNSPEKYYKESIFVSSTNSLILNLETLFKQNNIILLPIEILLPTFTLNENISKPMNLNIFCKYRMHENAIRSEYLLWCEKWKNVEKTHWNIEYFACIWFKVFPKQITFYYIF